MSYWEKDEVVFILALIVMILVGAGVYSYLLYSEATSEYSIPCNCNTEND